MEPNPIPQSRFFTAYRDGWVTVCGGLTVLLCIVALPLAFSATNLPLWQRVVMAGVMLITAVSVVDKLFFTVYELGQHSLVVHSQLRRAEIEYRKMRKIKTGGALGLISTKRRKRFALSRKNLVIMVQGALWDEITVSPYHLKAFTDELLATIDSERSRRATVSTPRRSLTK